MTNIIDLNLLVQEPLKIKGTDGETYTIPGGISTDFVLKLMACHERIKALKKQEEILSEMIQVVVDILNLDKSKNVTLEYVKEHFDNINVLTAIISIIMKHVEKISTDPNSNTPVSPEQEIPGGVTI